MLQILFAWSDEHLHHFHIFGKDYGSNAADTRHVTLQSFAFQPGERFRYVYNYYAQWQCGHWFRVMSSAHKRNMAGRGWL
jgi:hypothetical protein